MFHLIGIGGVEYSVIFILSLLGFKIFFHLIFPSSSHVSESVNNSIFHQIAEQLQQQNLEHLRQQLLEQQQPQKVCNSILWSLELLLFVFCKMVFLKYGDFSSTLLLRRSAFSEPVCFLLSECILDIRMSSVY